MRCLRGEWKWMCGYFGISLYHVVGAGLSRCCAGTGGFWCRCGRLTGCLVGTWRPSGNLFRVPRGPGRRRAIRSRGRARASGSWPRVRIVA